MENKININLEWLSEKHTDEIPLAYIPVFTDHPWHEEFECACGAGPYSLGCQRNKEDIECEEFKTGKLFLIKNEEEKCGQCEKTLIDVLKPIYTFNSVKEDYLDSLKKPGFLGVGAFRFNKLAGFCWGYNFPLDNQPKTGSTWYKEAGEILKNIGADPEKSFYHNESGTLYEHRGLGIGTAALQKVLKKNAETHDYAVFRTINPAMVRCYEKSLGLEKNSLKPQFNDPNPDKRQLWYVLNLNKFKNIK